MIDEGAIKFESRWKPAAAPAGPEVDDLITWRKPLHDAGLIGHFEEHDVGYGNLSARLGDSNDFVISGTQTGDQADVGPEHFAQVTDFDIDGNTVISTGAVEASSESLTHAAIYQLDPAIRAVVHVHSDRLWNTLKEDLPATRSDVAYGTPAMAHEFTRLYRDTSFAAQGIAVMTGHEGGLISFGQSVREAASRILALVDASPGSSGTY